MFSQFLLLAGHTKNFSAWWVRDSAKSINSTWSLSWRFLWTLTTPSIDWRLESWGNTISGARSGLEPEALFLEMLANSFLISSTRTLLAGKFSKLSNWMRTTPRQAQEFSSRSSSKNWRSSWEWQNWLRGKENFQFQYLNILSRERIVRL